MRYKFLNLNPMNKRELDCVCRAISLALNKDYYNVEDDLYLVGQLFKCEKLCVCCYKHLLDYVYKLERIEEFKGLSIEEFINCNPYGTYIIRVDSHLTCCIDSILFDTWDCRNEIVDIVWQV